MSMSMDNEELERVLNFVQRLDSRGNRDQEAINGGAAEESMARRSDVDEEDPHEAVNDADGHVAAKRDGGNEEQQDVRLAHTKTRGKHSAVKARPKVLADHQDRQPDEETNDQTRSS